MATSTQPKPFVPAAGYYDPNAVHPGGYYTGPPSGAGPYGPNPLPTAPVNPLTAPFVPFTDTSSQATANQIAQMLGGTVTPTMAPYGGPQAAPSQQMYQITVGNHQAFSNQLADYLNQNNGSTANFGWANLPGTNNSNYLAPTYNASAAPPPTAAPPGGVPNNVNVSSSTRPGMTPPATAPDPRAPAVDPTRMQVPPPPVTAQPPQAMPPVVAPRAATPPVSTAPGPRTSVPPISAPAGAPAVPSATGGRPPSTPSSGTPGGFGFQLPPAAGSSGQQPGGGYSFNPALYAPQGSGSNGGYVGGNAPYGMPPSNPWTANSFLGDQTNDVGYLRGIAQNAGYATDQTPAWQAMIAAQQDNINRNKAQIAEQFNVGGGRFSTGFGDALQNYMGQTSLDQNSILAQITLQSQDAARQRELQAAGQLGSQAYQGASQLSQQDYGMNQFMQQQALQAAMQGASGADSAAQLMAQLGAQGVNSMNQNAMSAAGQMYGGEQNAAQNLFNTSNQGAMAMYNAQNQMLPAYMQYDTALRGLGLQGANNLSQNWMTNLNLGNQMGQTDWTMNSDNLNRQYQEWLRTQAPYSPYLPYMYQAATSQPLMYTPGYAPSQFGQTLGGIGGLLQGIGSIYKP